MPNTLNITKAQAQHITECVAMDAPSGLRREQIEVPVPTGRQTITPQLAQAVQHGLRQLAEFFDTPQYVDGADAIKAHRRRSHQALLRVARQINASDPVELITYTGGYTGTARWSKYNPQRGYNPNVPVS